MELYINEKKGEWIEWRYEEVKEMEGIVMIFVKGIKMKILRIKKIKGRKEGYG